MSRILIGIDCDVSKNGVAYKNGDKLELHALSFFELFDFLSTVLDKKGKQEQLLVVVEAGWQNKSNWHTKKNGSASLNSKIGNNTGRNHETGRKIVEMLEYLEITYKLVRPTASKINGELFKKITKIEGRTSQDKRDAMMLIWGMK